MDRQPPQQNPTILALWRRELIRQNAFGAPTFTLHDGDPFIALSHAFLEPSSNKTRKPMLPGEYEFTWSFQLGPWCSGEVREFNVSHFVNRGVFNITVADDGPLPTLTQASPTGGSCASVPGQISFTAYHTTLSGWINGAPHIDCAMTAAVMETPDPCRATVDAAQAGSISSIMTCSTHARPSLGSRFTQSLGWLGSWMLLMHVGARLF